MEPNLTPTNSRRDLVIAAAQTPAGFLALAMVIAEGLLISLIARSSGNNWVPLFATMLLVLAPLAWLFYIVLRRPEVFRGRDIELDGLRIDLASARREAQAANASLEQYKQKVVELEESNRTIHAQLGSANSLEDQLVAVLHSDEQVREGTIFYKLGALADTERQARIRSVLGRLILRGDAAMGSVTDSYRAVKK